MDDPILETRPLGFTWPATDPFLFCVHHRDNYPTGNEQLGPAATLEGRNLGMDFEGKDGWRMYHGEVVPGFPQHPHRGFETITIARRGYIDHSDSLGATARFGRGDVQWMTAGAGIVHSEMFPLLDQRQPNPLELFQIWLNLPPADKFVPPNFAMLWEKDIPRCSFENTGERRTAVTVIAGSLEGQRAPPPPPHSWAARSDTDVAIYRIEMQGGARFTLPAASHPKSVRTLYFFEGSSLKVAGRLLDQHMSIRLQSSTAVALQAGPDPVECLLLQGRPIGEPVFHYGPFVMNSAEQLKEAILDYRRTRYGGWPWPSDSPVHDRDQGRFAKHADGRIETVDL